MKVALAVSVFIGGMFAACAPVQHSGSVCYVRIFEDGSWSPIGWRVEDGYPPPNCEMRLANGVS